jgi:glycosyltransferase involved in cell wall biosynthesis
MTGCWVGGDSGVSLTEPWRQGLRVLQVLPSYLPAHRYGGPVQSVHGLGRGLTRLGVDVTVFTTNIDGPDTLQVPLERETDLDGVHVWYFPVEFPRSWSRALRLGAALTRRVKEFDLVHVHGLYQYPTWASSRACRLGDVPYVLAPRGMLDPHAIRVKSTVKKRLYLALVEQRNLEHAAALHFTSAEERMLAAATGIRTPGFVVPNGLDLAEFSNAQGSRPGPASASEAVLFLSRIDPKKGLDLLIPAFAQVAAAWPNARLTLAGPDNSGYLSTVQALIRHHGLQDSVTYAGLLLGQDKLDALREAAMLVLPSYSENFGMAVIEALACGIPVVISDRVNIWAQVVESGAGLVTPCDATALAGAMLEMLRNPSRRREMGRKGRELVEREFTWDRLAQEVLDAYSGVLQRPEARFSGWAAESGL